VNVICTLSVDLFGKYLYSILATHKPSSDLDSMTFTSGSGVGLGATVGYGVRVGLTVGVDVTVAVEVGAGVGVIGVTGVQLARSMMIISPATK
jgi:hypothetical protein